MATSLLLANQQGIPPGQAGGKGKAVSARQWAGDGLAWRDGRYYLLILSSLLQLHGLDGIGVMTGYLAKSSMKRPSGQRVTGPARLHSRHWLSSLGRDVTYGDGQVPLGSFHAIRTLALLHHSLELAADGRAVRRSASMRQSPQSGTRAQVVTFILGRQRTILFSTLHSGNLRIGKAGIPPTWR